MSCCGGKCGCGSGAGCKCGSSCGCGMYPDIEKTTTATLIAGVAPPVKMFVGSSEPSFGAEGAHGCKCGSNCTCDPCSC
ncbi:hypothetical protein U1Q18_033330 [Sarracenia purpurea var. burkii]